MTLYGTVVNGAIVLDGNPPLPDGARVTVDLPASEDDFSPAPSTETYEEHLAILRASVAEMTAGVPSIPFEEVRARLAAEFNLPVVAAE